MSQMSPAISASYDLSPHPTPADLSEAKASPSMTNTASRNSILQSDLAFLRHELHSVTQLCLTLCDPKDCSTPGSSVLHYIPQFAQIHVHWVSDIIQSSHPLSPPFSSCLQSFPASGSFPMSQFFTSGGQSIGASASVLPINIQG